MASSLRAGLTFIVGLTLLLGVAYPLLATAGSSADRAQWLGRLTAQGTARRSARDLIGQSFAGEPGYFQSRPSQTGLLG